MQDNEKLLQQLKEALVAIKKLKGDLQTEKDKKNEPIAVIGMAMRFPGGIIDAGTYWKVLETAFDCITDIPRSRFNAKNLFTENPDEPGKITLLQGGFLDNIDQFDGSFFDISYAELENMDPQQRLELELTYEALENAGLDVKKLVNSDTAVFAGISNIDYQTKSFRTGDYSSINHYSYSGQALCAHSGRISYLFGFQGPSVSIDTACSSGLVATDMAVKSLINNDSSLAIVTACNLIVDPELTIYFSHLNALSKNSRCKSFSNDGNGFVRSEGCATIVLKKLSDAQRDGDNILALIKGTAVNQDGRSNGFTAPSVSAQKKLLARALKNAQLNPEQIDYLEAHGTGTKIGDPIEMEAISAVYKKSKTKESPLFVGSVKTNFGHTEAVAGLAGIIKVILSMRNEKIPQNLHFQHPNELIDWSNLPINVPTKLTDWNNEQKYAGVSGFGVTGTNAHIILSSYVNHSNEHREISNTLFVLVLSAKSEESLKKLAEKYISFINSDTHKLEDICAMAALKRTHWEERVVFVGRNKAQILDKLNDFIQIENESLKIYEEDVIPKIVFVFPGQGSQWIGMGLKLMESEPVFKSTIELINEAYKKYVSWDLIEEFEKPETTSRWDEIDVIQPALVAIEIALAKLWESKGIIPDFVVGHSMGEVAAAYIGNLISVDEAAKIICLRSKFMRQQSGKGEMGVTDLTALEATQYIVGMEDKLSIAVMNSPNSTVISGDIDALNNVFERLEAEGRFCKKVKVDVASHSPQMEPIMAGLKAELLQLEPKDGEIVFYSTALNKEVNGSSLNADYWLQNLRNPVQFGVAIRSIANNNESVFIEMSPHPVLVNAIQENLTAIHKKGSVIPSFYRDKDESIDFLTNFGKLYASGFPVDWTNIYPQIGEFIQLPNYAWIKERFWYDKKHNISQSNQLGVVEPETVLYQTVWEDMAVPSSEKQELSILMVDNQHQVSLLLEKELQKSGNKLIKWNGTQPLSEILKDTNIDLFLQNGSIGDFDKNETSEAILNKIEQNCFLTIDALKYFNSIAKRPIIVQLTNGTQSVSLSDKNINLPAAILNGLGRTIDAEMDEFLQKRIDLPYTPTEDEIVMAAFLICQKIEQKEIVIRDKKLKTPILSRFEGSISEKITAFNANGAYLITGGTSGLGLLYAKWMVEKGARNIALLSRSGEKAETIDAISIMESLGAKVKVYNADVSNMDALSTVITQMENELGKWIGVVHAAGILDDASILKVTPAQFSRVMDSKVKGAWNLHLLSVNKQLDIFIMFSSGASVLGTAGQGNYVAANTFLDQLAHYRVSNGYEAMAINWGNIGEVGLAAAAKNRGERLKEQGMNAFLPSILPNYFNALQGLSGAQWLMMDIDFEKWAVSNPSISTNYFFKNVVKFKMETSNKGNKEGILKASSLAQAKRQLGELLKSIVSGTTKVPVNKIREDATFKSMGIDSLMALQLKNKLQTEFGITLAVSSIWAHPTVEKYGDFLLKELKIEDQFIVKVENQPVVEKPNNEESEELSFEELMKQLEEKTK